MKRFVSALAALVLVFLLSPCASALVTLEKPGAAQIIYLPADDYESYRADFYLCALTALERDGDDLRLMFQSSRIVLRGFFATNDERRALMFAGGDRVTAADFNADGAFLGALCTGVVISKNGAAVKSVSDGDGGRNRVSVVRSRGRNEISSAVGQAVYGAVRANAAAAADEYMALGCDWASAESIRFDFDCAEDGRVHCKRQTLTGTDGVTVVNLRPETVYVADSETLVPVAAGRAAVSFTNTLGESLQRLSIRITNGSGVLTVECVCPECGEDQGAALHMCACGHYTCTSGFGAAEHAVPECGIAGHCVTDGAAHGKCRNCLKPLCNGEEHGVGICRHEHTWTQKSYTAPTATTPGRSVAQCVTCGIIYDQTLPAAGG